MEQHDIAGQVHMSGPASDGDGASLAGWLEKLPVSPSLSFAWRRRWLALHADRLQWSMSPDSPPRGVLPLDASTKVELDGARLKVCGANGKVLMLRGANLDAWAAAIEPQRHVGGGAWKASGWSQSLPVSKWLLPKLGLPANANEAAAFIQRVTKDELRARLRGAGLHGHLESLWCAVEQLRTQPAMTGEELSVKFIDEGEAYKGAMDMAPLSAFFHGLEQLVGPPRIVGGSLRTAMEHEHCQAPDSNECFLRSMSKHAPHLLPEATERCGVCTRAERKWRACICAGPITPSTPRRRRSGRSSWRPRRVQWSGRQPRWVRVAPSA
jgi:hypothetical protein